MQTITLTLKEGDLEYIEAMAYEMRSKPQEAAVGLIQYAFNDSRGDHEKYKAFLGKILYEIVQYFDERPASWTPETSDVRMESEISNIALSRAESQGEKLQTYLARLIRADVSKAGTKPKTKAKKPKAGRKVKP